MLLPSGPPQDVKVVGDYIEGAEEHLGWDPCYWLPARLPSDGPAQRFNALEVMLRSCGCMSPLKLGSYIADALW